MNLVTKVLNRDPRAIAKAISAVENGSTEAVELLKSLFPHSGRSYTIGVTGAPGTGKSSLVDRLAQEYRDRGMTVGIIAVDPTSPFSGGAILGDRIRMQARSTDPGIFIRSMATRGKLGGLSSATDDVVLILDAAGYDRILIETVGVGQDEVDIIRTADATLVVLVPGLGDEVQAIKAGIMEIGDIFVLNKSDRDGTARLEQDLHSLLGAAQRSDGWQVPIVKTVAIEGTGTRELADSIESYRGRSKDRESGLRLERESHKLMALLLRRLGEKMEDFLSPERIRRLALEIMEKKRDPYSITDEILDKVQLGKGRREDAKSAKKI
ncbi:MAG TPA: methylmalonyl Co-A mutase-associated GTPase MeaB [Acidobacteriota bacterium]|jgi:LAO/AO transport system kinase